VLTIWSLFFIVHIHSSILIAANLVALIWTVNQLEGLWTLVQLR